MHAKSGKNVWALFLFLLAGIVIGGLLGYYVGRYPYFEWLNFGMPFGLSSPVTLELGILNLTFGIMLKINVAGIIGMALAVFLYRRVR